MTWFEKLCENPDNLYRFFFQASYSYSFRDHRATCCLEDLPVFRELGMKQFAYDECPTDCVTCEKDFLFDPIIYERTMSDG